MFNDVSRRALTPLLAIAVAIGAVACDRYPSFRCVGRELQRSGTDDVYWPDTPHYETVETCAVFCIDRGDDAFCAVNAEPSPRCMGENFYRAHCEENTLVLCLHDYVHDEIPCANEFCVEVGPPVHIATALCSPSPTPEPACESMRSTCIDGAWVGCEYGYATAAAACQAGRTCAITSDTGPGGIGGEATCVVGGGP